MKLALSQLGRAYSLSCICVWQKTEKDRNATFFVMSTFLNENVFLSQM